MCKLMVKILTLFSLMLNLNAAKMELGAGENIKPLRLGLFMGNDKESFCDGEGGAITYDFASALAQKALDVAIVSDYILKNLILRKYTKVSDPVLEKDEKDFDHILAKIDVNLSDWDFYYVQDTQFFVLVPQNYDNPIFNKAKWTKINILLYPEYNGSAEASFPIIPWVEGAPSEAKRLLSDVNLKHIPYAKNLGSKIIAKPAALEPLKEFNPIQLAWIFNPVEDYENLSLSQPCNIYISGHGTYQISFKTEISLIAGMLTENMASTLLFFNDKINTKSVRISSCEAGGRNLDLIQVKKNLKDLVDKTKTVPIRIKYLLIIDSITDAPTISIRGPEGSINANLKEYFDALEKFQNGYNDFVVKLNAIRATKEAADAETIKKIKLKINELEQESGLLDILRKISLPELWYFRFLGPNSYPQVWLPEIGWFQTFSIFPLIQKITDQNLLKFLAKPITEEIEIKGKKLAKLKHLEFDSTKTVPIKKQFAFLLYAEVVFANLEIVPLGVKLNLNQIMRWMENLYRYYPSIPCIDSVCKGITTGQKIFYIYPQIISMQHGDSLNLFSKITLPLIGKPTPHNGILNFLRDSFLILRDRSTSKTFFIKELQGFNDFSEILHEKDAFKIFLDNNAQQNKEITLQNVLITTRLTGIVKKDWTAVTLSFEFMGKPWFLSYSPKNLNPEIPVPPSNKEQFLWKFKESKNNEHKGNLEFNGLTYMAKLPPANYHAQLPTVRRLFKKQTIKSLKQFMIDLKPEDILEEMQESPRITEAEWVSFEQQTQLKLNLKRLKYSLTKLKQKHDMLCSRLEQLRQRLSSST